MLKGVNEFQAFYKFMHINLSKWIYIKTSYLYVYGYYNNIVIFLYLYKFISRSSYIGMLYKIITYK